MSMDSKEDQVLSQADELERSLRNGTGPWTTVCESWWHDAGFHGGRHAVLADPSYRDRAMASAHWDVRKYEGGPGFSIQYENDKRVIVYHRNTSGPQFEQLVNLQQWHGAVPDSYLISQEFVLLMELYQDPVSGNYFSITDDGDREPAIEITEDRIRIRTALLRRYQAARQFDLLLFTDSVVSIHESLDEEALAEQDVDSLRVNDLAIYSRFHGRNPLGAPGSFSRLLVKRILVPPSEQESGIWPWSGKEESYPCFIIGEDESGNPIRRSCDPEIVGDDYLRPVFFRRSVLKRYYDNPERFLVEDGRLNCTRLWSVQIDNGNPDVVAVFLGDLGRDLPASHRPHWLSHNIVPLSSLSEMTIRRSFFNQFAESSNPEILIKNAYEDCNAEWERNWGWPLYSISPDSGSQVFRRLRIPLDDSDTEFQSQLLDLAKLLVDLLNEREIGKCLEKIKGEKGISKLERFLSFHQYRETQRDIALLRDIQTLRSQHAAHISGSGSRKLGLASKDKPAIIKELFQRAVQMLSDLAQLRPLNMACFEGDSIEG